MGDEGERIDGFVGASPELLVRRQGLERGQEVPGFRGAQPVGAQPLLGPTDQVAEADGVLLRSAGAGHASPASCVEA